MPLLTRRKQLAVAVGTEGVYANSTYAVGNAKVLIYNMGTPKFEVGQFERDPQRATIGTLAATAGARSARITFESDMYGSGAAGTAPPWGTLLRACGFSETVNSGSETFGSAVAATTNIGVSPSPAISGTAVSAKSGTFVLELIEKDENNPENATFSLTFYPGDATEASTGFFVVTDTAYANVALTDGAGVAFDAAPELTVTDPDSGSPAAITTWRVGDRWTFSYASASQADVTYKPISTAIPCLNMAVEEDGRLFKFHSCRGTVRIVAAGVGQPGRFQWDFQGVPAETDTTSDNAAGIVDAAMLSNPVYPSVVPPPFQGVTATLFSATPQCFNSASIDIGNTVTMRSCAVETAGYEAADVVGRKVTGQIDPLGAVPSTVNPFANLKAGTLGNYVLQVGTTSGNIIRVTGANVQVSAIDSADRDGLVVDTQTLRFAEPEYDAGGDYSEIVIIAK